MASFDAPSLRVSVILRAALVLVLSLSALENLVAFAARSPLAYLVGAQSAADYRAASLGMYVGRDRSRQCAAGRFAGRVFVGDAVARVRCVGAVRAGCGD